MTVQSALGGRLYPQAGPVASARRVRALIRRHAYLLLKSWPRLVSMAYYPTVTMVLWAFLTIYLKPTTSFLQDAPGFFIGAVLLWDVLFRGQLGVSLTFIEEMYSRNLGNLFVSPLRLYEFIAGQLTMSVLRTLIGVGGACFFAWLLFRYSIFSLGFPLIAYFWLLLAFGWSIGLAVSAMILRWGLGAEELAWAAIFLVAPVSGVYYPIHVLPAWMQAIAAVLPSAHVFEGMRALLLQHEFRWDHFWWALGLDVLYYVLGVVLFRAAVAKARAAFDAFPPSHKREYVDWIVSAKTDETRQRRLATALEWMASGKSRNWKYERRG